MQTNIVIPDDIYEKIKIAAEKNYRTINQEINFRLNNSFNSSFATESFANTTSHTHVDITPPGVQSAASQTIQITPDPHANSIEIKPGVLPSPIKDYTKPQSQSEQKKRVID